MVMQLPVGAEENFKGVAICTMKAYWHRRSRDDVEEHEIRRFLKKAKTSPLVG